MQFSSVSVPIGLISRGKHMLSEYSGIHGKYNKIIHHLSALHCGKRRLWSSPSPLCSHAVINLTYSRMYAYCGGWGCPILVGVELTMYRAHSLPSHASSSYLGTSDAAGTSSGSYEAADKSITQSLDLSSAITTYMFSLLPASLP